MPANKTAAERRVQAIKELLKEATKVKKAEKKKVSSHSY